LDLVALGAERETQALPGSHRKPTHCEAATPGAPEPAVHGTREGHADRGGNPRELLGALTPDRLPDRRELAEPALPAHRELAVESDRGQHPDLTVSRTRREAVG